ncbi:MAG: hypothetical protein IT287_00010 [Bdellovibrionaceae bacterium]|nr:hypothetical protein [Pseudobdellovibrionaceae bacterium]
MFAMNLNKLNINEAELKAYILQQLNDMEPYIGDEPVAIKMAYTEDDEYIVKMIFRHEGGDIQAEGSGSDIFNAISKTKEAFIRTITSFENAYESDEFDSRPAVTSHVEKKTVH